MTKPSLFDELGSGTCPQGAGESPAHLPRSAWNEVPQETFLSWTWAEQLAYSAARDEDTAAHEDDPERREWFLRRAQLYKEEIDVTK